MRLSLMLLFLYLVNLSFGQVTSPFLKIETSMHSAMGRRASTDQLGKYVLTCSDDKTARLWDALTGKLLNTFRVPIGDAHEGKLFACALSPDGKTAVMGGWTGYEWDTMHIVYMFNTQTGAIFSRITKFSSVINDIEFSPDGKFMAVGLGGTAGVYVFETNNWQYVKGLTPYEGGAYSIAFNKNNQLATSCFNGPLRIYDREFNLIKSESNLSGQQPYSIVFDESGSKLAVGYSDVTTVEIRSAADLTLIGKPDITGVTDPGGLNKLIFSKNGDALYGGGGELKLYNNKWSSIVRRWENGGLGTFSDFPVLDNSIMDIKKLPGDRFAVYGSYPDMAVIDKSGVILWKQKARNLDFAAGDKSHFRVNEDGSIVSFTALGETPYSFDISTRTLQESVVKYEPPVVQKNGLSITNLFSYKTQLNGKPISFLEQGELVICADINANADRFVLGTSWNIYKADKNGKMLSSVQLPGGANAINITANGKYIVAALYDGTIRWYRMSDLKLHLVFYLHSDKKRWILYTPSGYYDASPGAEDLLGWHINNGADRAPAFYPVSRFKQQFFRPDVVDQMLNTGDELLAVKKANENNVYKSEVATRDIRQKLPPVISIISPENGSVVSSNSIQVKYSVSNPDGSPLKNLKVLVNGRPVALSRGIKPDPANTNTITVDIPSQESTITLLAENENGLSPEANLFLKWNNKSGTSNDAFVFKPKLYLLAIGISDYNNKDYKLNYASKDANDFTEALYKQKGKLYSDVVVKKFLDKDATKDAITDGLDWIQRETTQKDVAMIFYAGHGMNDNNGIFYMLPVGADLQRIRTTCLNFQELKQTVSSIAGKVIVFIDACHSGNVMGEGKRAATGDMNEFVNELSSTENGAITFTSSTGKEYSLENQSWGNGAFTKAVIEGLTGKASFGEKKKITIKSLDYYISERVKELTSGKQHPTSVSPPNVPDFPIAVGN